MKRLGVWNEAAPRLWHPPSDGSAGFEGRQNTDREHVVVNTFGRLMIVTDDECRVVEVAVFCGNHFLTTKGTIE